MKNQVKLLNLNVPTVNGRIYTTNSLKSLPESVDLKFNGYVDTVVGTVSNIKIVDNFIVGDILVTDKTLNLLDELNLLEYTTSGVGTLKVEDFELTHVCPTIIKASESEC